MQGVWYINLLFPWLSLHCKVPVVAVQYSEYKFGPLQGRGWGPAETPAKSLRRNPRENQRILADKNQFQINFEYFTVLFTCTLYYTEITPKAISHWNEVQRSCANTGKISALVSFQQCCQVFFWSLVLLEMIVFVLRRYISQSHRSLRYDVNSRSTSFFFHLLVELLVDSVWTLSLSRPSTLKHPELVTEKQGKSECLWKVTTETSTKTHFKITRLDQWPVNPH